MSTYASRGRAERITVTKLTLLNGFLLSCFSQEPPLAVCLVFALENTPFCFPLASPLLPLPPWALERGPVPGRQELWPTFHPCSLITAPWRHFKYLVTPGTTKVSACAHTKKDTHARTHTQTYISHSKSVSNDTHTTHTHTQTDADMYRKHSHTHTHCSS